MFHCVAASSLTYTDRGEEMLYWNLRC